MMQRMSCLLLATLLLVGALTACGTTPVEPSDSTPSDTGEIQKPTDGQPTGGLKLTTYEGEGFSVRIPEGWKIDFGSEGVTFWYRVTNPADESMQFFRYGKLEPLLKSEEARQAWRKWGPYTGNGSGATFFGNAPVVTEKNAKGIIDAWAQFVDYQRLTDASWSGRFVPLTDIFVTSCEAYPGVLTSAGLQPTLAQASCKTAAGTMSKLMLTACVADPGYQDIFNEGIDTYYMMVYELNGMLVPENCDETTVKSLITCLSSLQFTEEFVQKAIQQSNETLDAVKQRSKENEALMDAFMKRWGY